MPPRSRAAARPRNGAARGDHPIPAKTLHKREFIARIASVAEIPQAQAQARELVEITLAELGRAIAAGETLALPPFGRARVSRQRTVEGGEVLTIRLRRRADDERAWAWANPDSGAGTDGSGVAD